MNIRPEETFQEVIQRGVTTFRSLIQGVSEVLRTGDSAIKELDDALRGSPGTVEQADQTFLGILAMLRGAMEEARDTGTAAAPGVIQRAREALSRVTTAEPSWRPAPAIIRTTTDMFRMALRDLRGSESLIKLATGRGELNDLEKLVNWADDVSERVDLAQKVVAEPKVVPAAAAPVPPQKAQERRQGRKRASPKAGGGGGEPKAAKTKAKKTKKSAPPGPSPEDDIKVRDIIFRAFGEVTGDQELKDGAEKVAQGQMPPDQYVDVLIVRLETEQINPDTVGIIKQKALQNGADPNHVLMHDFFPPD